MKNKVEIEIEYIRSGQLRPYADSFYEFEFTINRQINKDDARVWAKAIHGCRRLSDEGKFENAMEKHFAPHLEKLISLNDNE